MVRSHDGSPGFLKTIPIPAGQAFAMLRRDRIFALLRMIAQATYELSNDGHQAPQLLPPHDSAPIRFPLVQSHAPHVEIALYMACLRRQSRQPRVRGHPTHDLGWCPEEWPSFALLLSSPRRGPCMHSLQCSRPLFSLEVIAANRPPKNPGISFLLTLKPNSLAPLYERLPRHVVLQRVTKDRTRTLCVHPAHDSSWRSQNAPSFDLPLSYRYQTGQCTLSSRCSICQSIITVPPLSASPPPAPPSHQQSPVTHAIILFFGFGTMV